MRRAVEGRFDPGHLPGGAQELADVIGLAALFALVEWRGGIRLWVPAEPSAEMIAVIGEAPAARLCAEYAGERLVIPKCDAAVRAARDAEIVARFRAGTPAAELATEYRIALRQVRRIVAGDPGSRARGESIERQGRLL